jgi:hypothetical protein
LWHRLEVLDRPGPAAPAPFVQGNAVAGGLNELVVGIAERHFVAGPWQLAFAQRFAKVDAGVAGGVAPRFWS